MSKLRVLSTRHLTVLLLLLTLPLVVRPGAATAQDEESKAESAGPSASDGAIASDDPSVLPSEIMPRASRSLLLNVVKTPSGYFVVGERGHILRSDDGKAWTQIESPTRSTLTSVAAVGDQLWAAGHDGVILHSADGGKSWQAQRRDPLVVAEGVHRADMDPRQGAPILDIMFSDARNGIAIGAYSLMLVTSDGGATWTPKQAIEPVEEPAVEVAPMESDIFSEEDLMLDEETNPHLNAIVDVGNGTLVIVGERGTLLRSRDGGESWQKLAFPYKGSMFGVLSLGDGRLLAFGLRGNVYESANLGSNWSKVQTLNSVSLMGGSVLEGGGAVLAGANGTVLTRAGGNEPFAAATFKNANGEAPSLADIVATGDGDYILVGDKGVDLYHLQ